MPNRSGAQITLAAAADRNGAFRRLTIADDQHIRHFLQLCLPNLEVDLLLSGVELRAQAGGIELALNILCIFDVAIGDRQHGDLHWSQPERKRPAKCSRMMAMNRSRLPKMAR